MKFTSYITLGLGLLLGGCALEDNPLPYEEQLLRSYIEMFGIIDPDQDWNLAEQSSVAIALDRDAAKIVVYANVLGQYYRVARMYNVKGEALIEVPLDIPSATESLAVEIDGQVYVAQPGEMINTAKRQAPSRAFTGQPFLNEDSPMGWVILAEDLGSTDDIDFNDFVASLSYAENSYRVYAKLKPEDWDIFDQGDQDFNIDDLISRAEGDAAGKTVVSIQALASGGLKEIYLHYRFPDGSRDFIIGPSSTVDVSDYSDDTHDRTQLEWHSWFGCPYNRMVNTTLGVYCPLHGSKVSFEVEPGFTFTTYSQMTFESENPMDVYNFNFDRRNIQGFYISVDHPIATVNGETAAYDLGKAIGHNRQAGLPPQMVLVPDLCRTQTPTVASYDHFRWPTERVKIDLAFSGFASWVTDKDGEDAGKVVWYGTGNEQCLIPLDIVNSIISK